MCVFSSLFFVANGEGQANGKVLAVKAIDTKEKSKCCLKFSNGKCAEVIK